jgi:hypothetical protein
MTSDDLNEMEFSLDFDEPIAFEDGSLAEKKSGFSGNISDVNLLEIVQFLSLTHKSKALEIYYNDKVGQLYIENGQIVHAVSGKESGEEVAYECLSCEGGSFKEIEWRAPEIRTIECATGQILIEAVRRLDENKENQDKRSDPDLPVHEKKELSWEKDLLAEVGKVNGISEAIIVPEGETQKMVALSRQTESATKEMHRLVHSFLNFSKNIAAISQFEGLQNIAIQSAKGLHGIIFSFSRGVLCASINNDAQFERIKINLEKILNKYGKY